MREKIENMSMDEFFRLCNRLVVEMGFKVRNSVYRDDTVVFDAYMPVPGKSLHYVIVFLKRPRVTRRDLMELIDVETVEVRWMLITTGLFEGVEDLRDREDLTLMDWNDFERLIVEFGLEEELTREERGKEAREGRYLPSAGEMESLLQWARDFLEKENYDKALEYVENALRIKPTAEGKKLKAKILGALQRSDEAISILTSILEDNVKDDEAWLILGQILEDEDDLEEAGEAYSQCVRFNPRNLSCWINRGNVMLAMEKYSEALLCYEKALEIRRDLPALWNNRGVALKYMGRYDEALRSYNAAIKIDRNFADAYLNKAHLYFDLKRYEEARNAVMEYLKLRREPRGLVLLAKIYMRRSMKKDARDILQEVLDMEPGNQEARELLDKLEGRTREVKEYEKSKQLLLEEIAKLENVQKASEIGDKRIATLFEDVKKDIEEGNISDAYKGICRIRDVIHEIELKNMRDALRLNTTRLLELAGLEIPENIDELSPKELKILGEEAVKRVMLKEEKTTPVQAAPVGFAHLLFEESRWKDLKGMDDKYAHNALGLRYMRARKYDLAEEHFRRAWALDKGFKEAELNLAYVYYKKGEKRKARALLKHLGYEEYLKKWEK